MADLLASGRLVDLILILVVLEVVVIAVYRRRNGGGIALFDLLPNIFAGVFLLVALRVALTSGGWMAISGCLGCAGIAHAIDLIRRWR